MQVWHTVPSGLVIVVATDANPCGTTGGAVVDDPAADEDETGDEDEAGDEGEGAEPPSDPHAATPTASSSTSSAR
jgi:hypothetical protein